MQSNRKPISFIVDANLDQSIDQGASPTPGTLTELINLRKDQYGRLRKRRGYTSTADPSSTAIVRLLSVDRTVAEIDQAGKIKAYSEGVDVWSEKDRAPRWVLSRAQFIAGSSSQALLYAGAASSGGVTVHVWIDNATGYVMSATTDETTGAVVRGPETVATFTSGLGETGNTLARVVAGGGRFWIVWTVDSAGSGGLAVTNLTDTAVKAGTAWPARTLLGKALDTSNPNFDLSMSGTVGSERPVIGYNNIVGGTHKLEIIRIDSSNAITHTYTLSGTQVRCVSVFSQVGLSFIWCHYQENTASQNSTIKVFDTTLTLLASNGGPSGPTTLHSVGLSYLSASSVLAVASAADIAVRPNGTTQYCTASYAAGVITLGSVLTSYGGIMASQPFHDGTDVYCWFQYGVPLSVAGDVSVNAYASFVLVALTHDAGSVYTGVAAAGLMPHLRIAAGSAQMGLYAQSPTTSYFAPQKSYALTTDTSLFMWDAAIRLSSDGGGTPKFAPGIKAYTAQRADVAANSAGIGIDVQGVSVASGGGQPYIFDREHFTELGFVHPPHRWVNNYWSLSASGGSIVAGTYFYALTYEYTDANGNRHESAPFFTTAVTHSSGTNNKTTFTAPCLRITTKQDREFTDQSLQIVVWRTLAGKSGIYYRSASGTNVSDATTVSIDDVRIDSDISSNETLYSVPGTSGSEIANEMPPPLVAACAWNNRVAGIDAEYRDRIVFSKPLKIGKGIHWSSALETYVKGIGDLVALAEMDGVLYAFSATAVAIAAYGDGVDATLSGSWPQPQVVSRAAGTSDARSLCVTQDGVIFVSRVGGTSAALHIWLLPRGGGNPIEIGQKVRKYLNRESYITTLVYGTQPLTVTACVNWVDMGRAVIHFRDSSGTSFALEYDYIHKGPDGLGVWNAALGTAYDLSGGVTAAHVANGEHWIAARTSPASVRRSSLTSYADDSTWVPWYLRTHDISPGAAASFCKLNAVNLTVETAGDNGGLVAIVSESSFQVEDANPGTEPYKTSFAFTGVTVGAAAQRYWQPPTRRSSTGLGYGFHFYSTATGGANNSADVIPSALTIDIIPLAGTHRPQATERV